MAADLKPYRAKRNFMKTPEPKASAKKNNAKPIFVVQKHDARQLHYDFRLEIDGVLKSWAVPKGPTLDPREKRLAVATEDHPLAYASFEGVIPEDAYGAGTVIVWDTGHFENRSQEDGEDIDLRVAYDRGALEVELHGQKLKGVFVLVKMKGRGEKNWLLMKKKDEYADARRNPVSTEPRSVLSGKTLDEVREAMT